MADAFRNLAAAPASLPKAGTLTDEDLSDIVACARTPVAIAQAGRLAREAGADTSALTAMAERLTDTVDHWGDLFVAILRWTAAKTTLDGAWSVLAPQERLTLAWLHADWLLDAFIRYRFEPSALIASFAVREEEMDALDRITTVGAGPVDQADPTTVTPHVLLVHGLAEILGETSADEILPSTLIERINAALRDGDRNVDQSVLLRRPELGDALGGFLTRMPLGLPAGTDIASARDDIVGRAFAAIAADPEDQAAWLAIVTFARRGLSTDQVAQLKSLINTVDHFAIARIDDHNPQPFVWRGTLAPLAWSGVDIADRIASLARRCARLMPGPVQSGSTAELAMSELVETALFAARTADGGMDHDRASGLLWVVATAWPAAAARLRLFVSRLLDGTAPTRGGALWNLGNDLNRLW